ncbi:MAG: LemA family protein, partial [Thermodesulfovibrionales bacterium]
MERIQTGNIIILGIVFLVMITAIWLYNSLIRKRNNINNAYSSIDALLKKRFDLIPNLVATVRQYMDYEKGLLNQLTELRAKAILGNLSFEEKERLAAETGRVIKNLIVAAEN